MKSKMLKIIYFSFFQTSRCYIQDEMLQEVPLHHDHQRKKHCHRPEAFYQILTCLISAMWVHVTYLFTKCVTESCDSPDWQIQYCLSSASSRVTETVSLKMPCEECFQKCFSAYNMISLWLNTVIPIIVMIWLPKMTRYLH